MLQMPPYDKSVPDEISSIVKDLFTHIVCQIHWVFMSGASAATEIIVLKTCATVIKAFMQLINLHHFMLLFP